MATFQINDSTPILHDFHIYIGHCEKHRPKLTKKNEYLNRKDLFALNGQMLRKKADTTPRTDQNLYFQLHLFQHLCLESRLFRINRDKATASFWEPIPEKLAAFRKLNPTEQYFFLFKTLWLYCNWAKLLAEERRSFSSHHIHIVLLQASMANSAKLSMKKNNRLDMVAYDFGVSLYHLELFGFWICQWEKGGYYREKTRPLAEALVLTDFGKKMAKIIVNDAPLSRWNAYFQRNDFLDEYFVSAEKLKILMKKGRSEEEATKIVQAELDAQEEAFGKEPFEAPFRALFPNGALGLIEVRQPHRAISGRYTFKVNLTHQKNIWRRIQLDAAHTLAGLHMMIQKAFKFDNDHLYAFYMDGQRFSDLSYNDPRSGDGPFADEMELAKCEELEINRKIFYLFDFGTEWHFDVVLESIDENAKPLKEGKIIESKGKAPEQYPDWEGEW